MTDTRAVIYRSPGRTEIIGNHTDHQNGCVIAAAINREICAEVIPIDAPHVTLTQDDHRLIDFDLTDTRMRKEERASSPSLVRGVANYLKERGYHLHGFNAHVTSHVPAGAGISSSAAYEILIGKIMTDLSDEGLADPVTLALAGLYAEKEYYGKPSGLMDQMAVANGGLTFIDFGKGDGEQPLTESLPFDPEEFGYQLCLTNTGGSHSDLTDAYAAIPQEMGQVAAYFGKRYLREVEPDEFFAALTPLRNKVTDRALLRAAHFFGENDRVLQLCTAMKKKDIKEYLQIVRASGRSSYELLQNIYPAGAISDQSIGLALMLSEKVLAGSGASRVHGGGFAGTIQAYVPKDLCDEYKRCMEQVFGEGSCHFVSIVS